MEREVDFDDLWSSTQPMMAFRERRHSVMLQATLSCGDGRAASARVRNISGGGMMAECRFRGAQGDRILISMRGLGELEGAVAWTWHNRIGVTFDEPVDAGAVIRRRSPQRNQPMLAPPTVARSWRPPLQVS